jgi:hypothetical protein
MAQKSIAAQVNDALKAGRETDLANSEVRSDLTAKLIVAVQSQGFSFCLIN